MEKKRCPELFYSNCCSEFTQRREKLKKKIYTVGTIRLVWIVGGLLTLWFIRGYGWEWIAGVAAACLLPFIGWMVYHNKLFAAKAYAESMIRLCEEECKGLKYDFSAFDGAPEQIDGQHSFSLDLDVFGDKSVFQSVNRTVTVMGREQLIDYFLHPLDRKGKIFERQEAAQELTGKPEFCQSFRVNGLLAPDEKKHPDQLHSLLQPSGFTINEMPWKLLVWLVPFLWLVLLAAYAIGWVGNAFLGLFFALSFFVANIPAKRINRLYQQVNKMEKLLFSYSELMSIVESEKFHSGLLNEMKGKLSGGEIKASAAIREVSSCVGALDQRFSLAGILANIFYLRDTRQALLLEKWKEKHLKDVPCWFEALAGFDAMISLGTFTFNHPDYIFPDIADSYFKMEGKRLGHPLIPPIRCVLNDITIPDRPSFLIITGANMAGKSTYLRTVGVNFLLGCLGAPVCADSLVLYPAHLVTSLRTADSLASNESYFFAELKRLEMIINRLKNGEELFIILDEILKGTNSIDKQKGSLALMKQLVARKTCGIIATHDLMLGSLEKEFPEQVKNYRFEADIVDDELTFSYLLREGIAQNMNASFLMKKMGITV